MFIQRLQPDAYFTAAQSHRMQELLTRRATLTAQERVELETLIDANWAPLSPAREPSVSAPAVNPLSPLQSAMCDRP